MAALTTPPAEAPNAIGALGSRTAREEAQTVATWPPPMAGLTAAPCPAIGGLLAHCDIPIGHTLHLDNSSNLVGDMP